MPPNRRGSADGRWIGSGCLRTRMRRFVAQGLQGQEFQPEPNDRKNRSALRWLSVLAGYTTTPVSLPTEAR